MFRPFLVIFRTSGMIKIENTITFPVLVGLGLKVFFNYDKHCVSPSL